MKVLIHKGGLSNVADAAAPANGYTADTVTPRLGYSRTLLFRAAILSLGAGAIHLAIIPDHLREYLPFGLFFILVGVAQVGAAIATILMPSRRLFAGVSV